MDKQNEEGSSSENGIVTKKTDRVEEKDSLRV